MPDNEVNKIIGSLHLGIDDLEKEAVKVETIIDKMFSDMNARFSKGNPAADYGMTKATKTTALQAAKIKAIEEKTEAEKTAILQKGEAQREVILKKAAAPLESRAKQDLAIAEKTAAQIQAIELENAAKISEIRSRQSINEAKEMQEIAILERAAAQKEAIERESAARIAEINSRASISDEKALVEVAKTEKVAAEKIATEQVANAKVRALRDMTEVSTQEKMAKTMAYVEKTNSARVNSEELTQARIEALNKKTNAQIEAMHNRSASNMEHRHNTMLGRIQASLMHHIGFMAAGGIIGGIGIPMYEGLVEMEKGMAGVAQVLPVLEHDQALLNQVSEEYVNIMQRYGQNVQEVTDGAKLWGRQYKDIQTVQNLVNSTTLLSIVDNIGLAKSNQALEATMNQYGMTARNAAEAQAYSMRIVDSWSNIAHNAQVSALDLAEANERTASVAHKVGVEYDYLQGMITGAVRSTGMPGANIGNMLKSVFGSIHSDKAVEEIEALGVKMKQTGKDGVKSWRPVQDVMMDVIFATRGAKMDTEELTKAMAGGKFQWAKLAAMMGDFDTIIKATALSINSQGKTLEYAEIQMDTIERKAKQVKATLVDLFNQGGNDGLRTGIKATLDAINQFLMGLKQVEPYAVKLAGLGAVGWGLVTVWKTMFTTLQPLVSAIVAARTATTTLAAAETAQAAAAATATGAISGLAIATGVATFGLSLLVGGIAAWIYKAGEAEKAEINLQTAFQDELAINQQKAMQYREEADFLANATGYREKLIAKLKDEKLSANDLAKTKNDLAAVEESMKIIVGEEAWARIKASKDKNKAIQDEINKIKDLEKATKDASVKKINAEIETTNRTITEINKRITGYQTEMSVLMSKTNVKSYFDSLEQTKQAWNKEAAKDPYIAMRISPPKSVAPLIKQTGKLYNSGDVKLYTDLANKKAADEKKLLEAIKQLDTSKKNLMSLMSSEIPGSGGGGSVASGGEKSKTDPLEPYRQYIDNLEYSFDYLKKFDPKTKKWLDPVRKATENVRVEIEKLKAKEDILKDTFDVNGKRVQDLTPIYANHKSQIAALTREEQALAKENVAYLQGLKGLDNQQALLTNQYKAGHVTQKEYREGTKLLTDERRRLEKAINDNIVAVERDKKVQSDLRKSDLELAQSAKEAAKAREEAVNKRWDNAFQAANDYMNHEVNSARWSTEQQIEFYEKLRSAHEWTQKQMWDIEEGMYKARKEALDNYLKEIDRAHEEELDRIEEEARVKKAAIQTQIDDLDIKEKNNDRDDAERDHNEKMLKLQEELAYEQARTGKEHRQKEKDINEQIAEENRKWEEQQRDWKLSDDKEALERQLQAVDDAAEEEKRLLEDKYEKVKEITESGIMDVIASLAATGPEWADVGKQLIDQLIAGMKTGDFSEVETTIADVRNGESSNSDSSSGVTPDEAIDTATRDKAGITIGPGEYTLIGDTAAMKSRELADRLDESVTWDDARKKVEIGDEWFTPLRNDNGTTYVGVREVAEALGYTVDWDSSGRSIDIYKAAEGGIFMNPAMIQVAEAGYPEVVLPLQNLQPMINTAVRFAFGSDGSTFDRAADRIIAAINAKMGVNIKNLLNIEHNEIGDEADIDILTNSLRRDVLNLSSGK